MCFFSIFAFILFFYFFSYMRFAERFNPQGFAYISLLIYEAMQLFYGTPLVAASVNNTYNLNVLYISN